MISFCMFKIWPGELTLVSACQVAEVEENLMKTKEELQNVRRSDSVQAASSSSPSPSSSSDSESDREHSEENSTHSAELQTQDFSNHHLEEERLTEAEKNKQLQEKLKVR